MAKILIVDDQKSVLLTLESVLQSKGHFVVSATSAYDAMERLSEQTFELMITDAVMPGGRSGFELTRTVREQTATSQMPIIVLTGKREKEDVQRAIDVGANDYIIKPLDPEILLAKVASLLIQKGIPEKSFPECSVSAPATFKDETSIISISEVGMTLSSNMAATVGTRIKVESDLFAEIGIPTPFLRVISCSPPEKDTNKIKVSVQFIGFSEKEYQPLRLYIASKRRTSAA